MQHQARLTVPSVFALLSDLAGIDGRIEGIGVQVQCGRCDRRFGVLTPAKPPVLHPPHQQRLVAMLPFGLPLPAVAVPNTYELISPEIMSEHDYPDISHDSWAPTNLFMSRPQMRATRKRNSNAYLDGHVTYKCHRDCGLRLSTTWEVEMTQFLLAARSKSPMIMGTRATATPAR